MDNTVRKLEDTAGEMLREAAQRYGAAATEYGNLLTAYARGDSDAADLAKRWFNFSADQLRGLVESGFSWSAEYYKWVLRGVGVTIKPGTGEHGEPQAHRAPPKPKR